VTEYHSLTLEGESSISEIPDLSMLTERQRAELGDEISFGLAVALIHKERLMEAEHLLSMIVKSGESPWNGYAERFSVFMDKKNRSGMSVDQFFDQSDFSDPLKMKNRALLAFREQGREGFSELIDLFLKFPAGAVHREVMNVFYSSGYFLNDLHLHEQELVTGKLALLEKEYSSSEALLESALLYGYGGTAGIVGDLVNIYRRTGRLLTGGRFLTSAAQNPSLKAGKWELLLGAGRLYRWAAMYNDARSVLEESLEIVPENEHERVLWYLQDCRLKAEPENGGAILREYASLWQDSDYFSDSIESLTSYIVRTRRWKILNDIFPTVAEFGAPGVKAKIFYIAARLGEEGIYKITIPSGGEVGVQITSVEDSSSVKDDTPWNNLFLKVIEFEPNSYYAWLARKHLGITAFEKEPLPSVHQTNREASIGLNSEKEDPVLNLLTEMEYYALAMEWIDGEYKGSPGNDSSSFLKLARYLQTRDLWLDSIRLITRLPRECEPAHRSLEELFLYYPRPHLEFIEASAERYGHSPALILGLVREESGFTPAIESWAGAVGLMQIMPSTGADVASRMKLEDWDLEDPGSNLEMGSWYLKWLKGYVGGLMPSILAYNGGPGRIRSYLKDFTYLPEDLFAEGLPMGETRKYGPKVLVSALYYGYLYYGISPEETIAGFFPEL